ncbi:hypothetical protein DFP72DRAFT_860253 [Ephemerocybe angulata]|uniref:Uncharacterized protein n=1 Tax=Ephemerocybe angulata TaxID=980116 RepID=A0A8H6H966_9AGAR|nr:hypothetical protein DFP72DRAFT_860253 [Tulosesus angulatus]
MATTIIYNRLVVHGLARALALSFTDAHPGIDRYVVLALALDGDRTRGSVITADHTRTVARVAARVRDVLLPPKKRDFTEILGEVALELLRQADEGDVEGLKIRACLVAEFYRAGILDGTAVLEQAISCVVMRDVEEERGYSKSSRLDAGWGEGIFINSLGSPTYEIPNATLLNRRISRTTDIDGGNEPKLPESCKRTRNDLVPIILA